MPKGKWYGAAFRRDLHRHLEQNLEDAADDLVKHLRAKVSVRGPAPSAPGDPPHYQSGHGHDSIDKDQDGLFVYVGTTAPYMAMLEEGTDFIEPRPWLEPGFREFADRMARTICQPMNV
jgi:hypothetical protein